MKIPYGLTVEFYEDNSWQGTAHTLRGIPYEDDYKEMKCQNMPKKDAINSIKIKRTGGKAKAFWVQIGSSNDIEYTIYQGTVQESETSTSVERTEDFSYEVGFGIDFDFSHKVLDVLGFEGPSASVSG